jgi:hypothetical protein
LRFARELGSLVATTRCQVGGRSHVILGCLCVIEYHSSRMLGAGCRGPPINILQESSSVGVGVGVLMETHYIEALVLRDLVCDLANMANMAVWTGLVPPVICLLYSSPDCLRSVEVRAHTWTKMTSCTRIHASEYGVPEGSWLCSRSLQWQALRFVLREVKKNQPFIPAPQSVKYQSS